MVRAFFVVLVLLGATFFGYGHWASGAVTDTGGSGEVIGAGLVIAGVIWLAGKAARCILAG